MKIQLGRIVSNCNILLYCIEFIVLFVIIYLQKAKDFQIGPKDFKERKPIHDVMAKLVWLISTARNIIVVVVCAVMAYVFEGYGEQPFILTGLFTTQFLLLSRFLIPFLLF